MFPVNIVELAKEFIFSSSWAVQNIRAVAYSKLWSIGERGIRPQQCYVCSGSSRWCACVIYWRTTRWVVRNGSSGISKQIALATLQQMMTVGRSVLAVLANVNTLTTMFTIATSLPSTTYLSLLSSIANRVGSTRMFFHRSDELAKEFYVHHLHEVYRTWAVAYST